MGGEQSDELWEEVIMYNGSIDELRGSRKIEFLELPVQVLPGVIFIHFNTC
jgi:hypothetical protein